MLFVSLSVASPNYLHTFNFITKYVRKKMGGNKSLIVLNNRDIRAATRMEWRAHSFLKWVKNTAL